MRLLNQETQTLPIDTIRPHPRNPRQGDVGAIHTSIEANGFYGAIIAQKSTGYILAGNHRWKAAQQAGATEVPVTWVDVDDDHALRILLADNRTNDLATYDDTALAELLKDVMADAGTLAGTGYDGDDLDDLLKDLGQIDTTDMPDLPDGDRDPYRQMTFTLHDEQAETVEEAIRAAKGAGDFIGPNENGNGNALARIAEAYLANG